MSWNEVSDPQAVLKAIAEYDQLGAEAFHEQYGYRGPRTQALVVNDVEYPSKAILGVAYGFQFPDEGPLRSDQFTGGEHTVKRHLTKLGFEVRAPRRGHVATSRDGSGLHANDGRWTLRPGDSILRTQLHDRYGGTRQGGIAPSARSKNVLIFSDLEAGSQFGYIFDGWVNGVFQYTGEGQVGDQMMIKGNRAIRDHAIEGRSLHVFEGVRGNVRYVGEFHLDDERPFFYAEAPDRNDNPRQVIVFRLIPADGIASSPDHGEAPETPASSTSVVETSVERHQTDTSPVQPPSDPREAVRREQPLVQEYKAHLERLGHEVARFKIRPRGEVGAMFCDLFDKTANVLYEAKGSGTRDAIRMAIGQLADYVRFAPDGVRRAVLLRERPRPDLENLLRSQDVIAVWRSADGGFRDNSAGSL